MPKVRGPLFSLKATGTLGKTLTYKKGVAGNIVRMFRKPKGTRNAAQSNIRTWFQRGVWTWQGLSGDHGYYFSRNCYGLQEPARQAWRGFRTTGGLFGYYAFMKRWLQRSLYGQYQYQVPPNFGFCVADEWLANFLYANGKFHDWVSPLPPIPPEPPTSQYVEGIVGLWHMDEDVDPTPDSSGNGNDGILKSAGHPAYTANGKFGGCFGKVAITDYINLGNKAEFSGMSALTLNAYIKMDSPPPTWGAIIAKFYTSNLGTFWFAMSQTKVVFAMVINNVLVLSMYNVTMSSSVPLSVFNMATAVWDPAVGECRIYVNAIEVAKVTGQPTSGTISSSSYLCGIGNRHAPGWISENNIDYIDEVAIINRAVPAAELLQIYNNNIPMRAEP